MNPVSRHIQPPTPNSRFIPSGTTISPRLDHILAFLSPDNDVLWDAVRSELVSMIANNLDIEERSALLHVAKVIVARLTDNYFSFHCNPQTREWDGVIHQSEVRLNLPQQEIVKLLFLPLVEALLEFIAQANSEPDSPASRIKLNGNPKDMFEFFIEQKVIEGKNGIWLTWLDKNAGPETETKGLIFLATPDKFNSPVDLWDEPSCDEVPALRDAQTSALIEENQPVAVQVPSDRLTRSESTGIVQSIPFAELYSPEPKPERHPLLYVMAEFEADRLKLFNLVLNKVLLNKKAQENEIKALLDKTPELIHAKTKTGNKSLLHIAAGNGHESIVLLLLERGHETNPVNDLGETPYQHATTPSIKQLLAARHKK